ncbi:MAG: universal stress protein [Syntrophomonadaceae bacterium]|nr:universal stress protein [Syntrophomonadaceae bacterium]
MFPRILVPIDGSPLSFKAIDIAQDLIKAGKGSRLTLIHVTTDDQDLLEKTQGFAERVLEEGMKRVSAEVQTDVRLEIGAPAEVISRVAGEEKYDLIVMGTRGLTPIKSILIGSVSAKVSALSPCHVLLVK